MLNDGTTLWNALIKKYVHAQFLADLNNDYNLGMVLHAHVRYVNLVV